MLLFYDAAYAPATFPVTDGVLIYAGGDTPHPWTLEDIARQTASLLLPCWVRSDPQSASATADAQDMLVWLAQHDAPAGICTVLDLETAIDDEYVNVYVNILHGSGYLCLTYGSSSTLPEDPVADGYFMAIPGATKIPSGDVGVQFAYDIDGDYDLDWFLPTLPFWNIKPVVTIPPLSNESETTMNCLDPQSNGTWIVDPIDGHVETQFGAPYLGGLNNPHPDLDSWEQVGTIAGITPYFIPATTTAGTLILSQPGTWGYAIIVRHFSVIEPSGAWYSSYTFPRSGANV